MAINPIGNRSSGGSLPIGATVSGIVNDPSFLQMNGQIVNRVDYPKLHTALDSIPKPYLEDVAVPALGSTEVYDITFGNSKYVAIAEGGKFATSPDGVTWTLQAGSITATLLSFANGIFYAGGTGGRLYSSTDGITWTQRLNVSGNRFGRVVYNGTNGYFVIGTNGDVYSSTNGTTWGVDYVEVPFSNSGAYVSDVVWNSSASRLQFIISNNGVDFLRASLIWSGSDLTADTYVSTNITALSGTIDFPANLLFFNSSYVAAGKTGTGNYKIMTSSNMTTWTQNSGGLASSGVLNWRFAQDANTRIVSISSSSIYTATNATSTWTQQTHPFGSSGIVGVARGTSSWAAVAKGNKVASANNTATTWTLQTSPFVPTTAIQGTDLTNDMVETWLVVGNTGKAAYSVGGASWLETTTGLSNNITSCAYGEGTWILTTTTEVPKYSTNLTSWTNVTGLPSATYPYARYCNGNFVVYRASTGMYFSTDGITWSASTTVFTISNTTADAMTCNNLNAFVVVDDTVIRVSADGDTWTTITHGSGLSLRSVYWNGTYFIATPSTAGTSFLRSTDGYNWEVISSFSSVLPTGAAGGVFWSSTLVSEDGINWFSTAFGTVNNIRGIGQQVIAVDNGKVRGGTSYNYDTTTQIFIPQAPNQTATLRTYMKVK